MICIIGAIIGAIVPPLAGGVIAQSLVARGGPFDTGARSPKQLGDFAQFIRDINALSARGLQPVASFDPFTGASVLSTADQERVLEQLLGEKFAREALAPTPEEIAAVQAQQQESIRLGRIGQLFPQPVAPLPAMSVNAVRDVVVANLTTTTARPVAPGVVSKSSSTSAVPKRLGGPCAGANTGFSRLRCARGGHA